MWVGIVVAIVIVLLVLDFLGCFRKKAKCQHCGIELKGTKQLLWGDYANRFVLCHECADKVSPYVKQYAEYKWKYDDYTNYLKWKEETSEYETVFSPTLCYGYSDLIMIDSDHLLFSIGERSIMGNSVKRKSDIFSFFDVGHSYFNFKFKDLTDGFTGCKVKGEEFGKIDLLNPRVKLEFTLNHYASYSVVERGIFNRSIEDIIYDDYFLEAIGLFNACVNLARSVMEDENDGYDSYSEEVSELQKALALFMFDDLSEVNSENLKKQRNAMIKAFHPDSNSDERSMKQAQKINAAYEIICEALKNK